MGLEDRAQTREIDGVTYEVRPLPFGIGNPALKKFIDLAAPMMATILAASGSDRTFSLQGFAGALKLLPTIVQQDHIDYFTRLFAPYSSYADGDKMVPLGKAVEAHFAGRYTAFYDWMRFSIEVNFGGFFSDLIARAKAAADDAAAKAAALSPETTS